MGIVFQGWDTLQGGGVDDYVNTSECLLEAFGVAHVTQEEAKSVVVPEIVTHPFLLGFVATEHHDFGG